MGTSSHAAAKSYEHYRSVLARRQSRADRSSREQERIRSRWRALLAAVILLLALSTGFLAGTQSTAVVEMWSMLAGSKEALAASNARRSELRKGMILFALPDGETCRPVHFDNQTGDMIPGTGTVPCFTREPRKTVADFSRFSWGR